MFTLHTAPKVILQILTHYIYKTIQDIFHLLLTEQSYDSVSNHLNCLFLGRLHKILSDFFCVIMSVFIYSL